ncbi:hypothetical protein Patl1_19776 [Pistacia atlantica]|uniref:Uncharacterized protein n=1 Tax=Pistacia atlantica TaxID=434234 RepID=A0ACC1BIS1_9ROSI|nr:hypothetical protein Patl1_19776 [Pistacia atlantica]
MTEIILGLQGDIPSDSRKGLPYVGGKDKVAACTKHFVGDGGTTNGINENNTVIDLHELLSIHMPAYSDSIIKGVSIIMVSYSRWNGVKMHTNRELVTGFLKNILKFKVRVSGVLTNAPFLLNLDCDHYVNNRKAVREAMCFLMDPRVGKRVSFVQFSQRFDGIDKLGRYANKNRISSGSERREADRDESLLTSRCERRDSGCRRLCCRLASAERRELTDVLFLLP